MGNWFVPFIGFSFSKPVLTSLLGKLDVIDLNAI
jgi:hypothetical protein